MFCNTCGEKINNNDKFCGACGANVNSVNQLVESNFTNGHTTTYNPHNKNTKVNLNSKIIGVLVLLICIGGVYIYKSYTSVNSSKEKVVKEFIMSINDGDYEKFFKTMCITSKDYKENIDLQKNFIKEAKIFRNKATEALGQNWDKKFMYIAKDNKDKVEILFEGKTFIEVPTIKIKNKYYIDMKLEDLL